MHEPELMMSIIVGSTAFIGLTGVVMGQVKQFPSKSLPPNAKRGLLISYVLGIFAVLLAIISFGVVSELLAFCFNFLVPAAFVAQIASFSMIAYDFWKQE